MWYESIKFLTLYQVIIETIGYHFLLKILFNMMLQPNSFKTLVNLSEKFIHWLF